MNTVLYADFEVGNPNNDMFVVTPEGNYYNFPGDTYDESHEDITVVDTKSHRPYTVKFND